MILISDDFNTNRLDDEYWADIQGGSIRRGFTTGADSLFFGAANETDQQRFAESVVVDISTGGTVSFDLIFGTDFNGGNNASPNQDVVLEYSTDGGTTWTILETYDTEDYANWSTPIIEDVPAEALSNATQFRWRQQGTPTPGTNNWALDDVTVTGTALASQTSIFDDFNQSRIDPGIWADIKGGSVRRGLDRGPNILFFGSPSDGGGQRSIESVPMDVRDGGTVSFDLSFGNDLNGGENADPGEDVVLEYSTDRGDTWVLVNTYDSEDYSHWTRINEDVPDAAFSDATRFRLRQVRFDVDPSARTGLDNWGVDNFDITNTPIVPPTEIFDDFDTNRIDWENWVDLKGGSVGRGFSVSPETLFFGSSNDEGGQRLIESVPMDVSQGGIVSFELIFGDGLNGGDNADPGEDVVLEYSIDDGENWVLVDTYDTEDYTHWTRVNAYVPNEGLTSSTSFRLRQLQFDADPSETGVDNWGLNNFRITGEPIVPPTEIFDDFDINRIDGEDWADIKGGSVGRGFSIGPDTLFFGSSSNGGGQRLIESVPVNVRSGGTVSFDIIFGDGFNGGDDADPGEDVVLEYSIDDGENWVEINTYGTENYTSWTEITENIPAAASTGNTKFRLRQIAFDQVNTSENGEDNWGLNDFAVTPSITAVPPDIDLVIDSVTTETTEAIFGEDLEISWVVRNQGSEATTTSWRDRIYLSTDTTLSTEDIALDEVFPNTTLAADATYSQTTSVNLPLDTDLPDGDYYILVRTDDLDNQAETTEINNLGTFDLSISNPLSSSNPPSSQNIDLVVDANVSPTEATAGESLTISWTVSNQGTEATEEWSTRIYLSTDESLSNDDIFLDVFLTPNSQLAPGETYSQTASVNLPDSGLSDGNYYVLVNVNDSDVQGEATETENNLASASLTLNSEPESPQLRSVSTSRGGNSGQVTVEILGEQFDIEAIARLTDDAGNEIVADEIIYINPEKIFATFDLQGVEPDLYTVEVENSVGTVATLENGFTVVEGGSPNLSTRIDHPPSVETNEIVPLTISFTNIGNVDVESPLALFTSDDGIPIALSEEELGLETSLELILQEQSGVFDVLRPGATGSIDVFARAGDVGELDFSLSVLDEPDTPLNWDGYIETEEEKQPELFEDREFAEEYWELFQSQFGETVGSLRRSLVEAQKVSLFSSQTVNRDVDDIFDPQENTTPTSLENIYSNISFSIVSDELNEPQGYSSENILQSELSVGSQRIFNEDVVNLQATTLEVDIQPTKEELHGLQFEKGIDIGFYVWDVNGISFSSNLKRDVPTYVITHGFKNRLFGNSFELDDSTIWMRQLAGAIRDYDKDANIILVDWGEGAYVTGLRAAFYALAVNNVEIVGKSIANYLGNLDINSNQTTLIGHSLGAHVFGDAAEEYSILNSDRNKNISRIVALDPAGPGFEHSYFAINHKNSPHKRLSKSDADEVYAIHTSDELGFDDPLEENPDPLADYHLYINPVRDGYLEYGSVSYSHPHTNSIFKDHSYAQEILTRMFRVDAENNFSNPNRGLNPPKTNIDPTNGKILSFDHYLTNKNTRNLVYSDGKGSENIWDFHEKEFDIVVQTFPVPEDSREGRLAAILQFFNPDPEYEYVFRIQSSSLPKFKINNVHNDGGAHVVVRDNNSLDYEQQSSYEITVHLSRRKIGTDLFFFHSQSTFKIDVTDKIEDTLLPKDQEPDNQTTIPVYEPSNPSPLPTKPGNDTTAKGDPHLTTFDGADYSFQAAGEFTLIESLDNDLTIQARYVEISPNASVASAVATLVDGHRVVIDAGGIEFVDGRPIATTSASGGTATVSIDGEVVAVPFNGQLDIGNSRIYRRFGEQYTIVYAGENGIIEDGDDQLVVNYLRPGMINVVDIFLGDEKKNTIQGLHGNLNDNPSDDIALRDGTPLAHPLQFSELYGDYRDAWRIKNREESLFDYEEGQGPDTFYNPNFPAAPLNFNDLDPDAQARGIEAALAEDYEPGTFEFNSAAFDFAITNDPGFLEGSETDTTVTEALSVVDDRPDTTLGNSSIEGLVFDDRNANSIQDVSETGLAGVTVFLDENQNGQFDPDEPSQATDSSGEYRFTGLVRGTYNVRQITPSGYEQTYPFTQTSIGDGFADRVLDYFDSGAGPQPGPYGYGGVDFTENVVLGNNPFTFLSLPTGSSVTVSFEDEVIVNGPGDDIFIREMGSALEEALVYVSSDLTTFTLLGIADGGTTTSLDLEDINFNQPVRAVKIVGLDNLGGSPGFDVVSVRGLPDSIIAPDFHTVSLQPEETVSSLDFGNRAVADGSFIQPDTAVASSEFSSRFQAIYTIDGSGLSDPLLGSNAIHDPYSFDNHWTSAAGTAPGDQLIDWGFNTPQNLDEIYIWNHQSNPGIADNPGYEVTLFDLTLFDAAGNILLTLDDVALQPDTNAAQTFSFGQTVANVSRVRFEIEDVQSSISYTGLAEVSFRGV